MGPSVLRGEHDDEEPVIQILAVQVDASATLESQIVAVRWYNPDDGNINVATVAVMVDWMQRQNGIAYIYDGRQRADVEVVLGAASYIQIRQAGVNALSLLNLPRF